MKHTKAPWIRKGGVIFCESQMHPIASAHRTYFENPNELRNADDICIANAKLIAAAPELLEYAIKVMNTLEEYGGSIVPHLLDTDSNDGQKLRDAIKKATE